MAIFTHNRPLVNILCICVIIGGLFSAAYYYGIHHAIYEFKVGSLQNVLSSQPNNDNNLSARLRLQRNELSKLTNEIKKKYGQQSCEMMKLQNKGGVSEFGGWCKSDSSPTSSQHVTDQPFLKALSAFLAAKTVGSFGDGPGLYKLGIDRLGQVTSYTAYDGAPYCEEVTDGRVNFLDLTVPHYGLPVFDWVLSFEVGEHIPKAYENIYLDNIARHAREGVVLSWAVIGQGGHSHINNKALKDVVKLMEARDFYLNEEMSTKLRTTATAPWLRDNIRVYLRRNKGSLILDDA